MSEPAVSVLSDVACHLGEGPSYDPTTDTLHWFDILERKMLSWRQGGATEITVLPEMASAVAIDGEGRQVLATETGLHLRNKASGRLTRIAAIEADDPATRSNDARVHSSGAFWIGTMGKKAERKAGSIWWYRRGELRRLFPEITISNSICFSPDGGTAFFADTAKNILFRVDCDPATGLPTGEPKVFLDHRGRPGGIDGSVIDAEGILWNARWGTGTLDAYDMNAKPVRSIAIPARQTSCPAFFGRDASRIAVTSAFEGMDAAARAADPKAGWTFAVDMPLRGSFEPRLAI
ncbi:MAG: SMP-30/gluconolactonase/LRE family protein [Rhizobiaceae bacterium]